MRLKQLFGRPRGAAGLFGLSFLRLRSPLELSGNGCTLFPGIKLPDGPLCCGGRFCGLFIS